MLLRMLSVRTAIALTLVVAVVAPSQAIPLPPGNTTAYIGPIGGTSNGVLGNRYDDVTVNEDDELFAVSADTGVVSRYEARTGVLSRTWLDLGSDDVTALAADSATVYLANRTTWSIDAYAADATASPNRVFRIALPDSSTAATEAWQIEDLAIDPSGEYLFALAGPSNRVFRLSLPTQALESHDIVDSSGSPVNYYLDQVTPLSGEDIFVSSTNAIFRVAMAGAVVQDRSDSHTVNRMWFDVLATYSSPFLSLDIAVAAANGELFLGIDENLHYFDASTLSGCSAMETCTATDSYGLANQAESIAASSGSIYVSAFGQGLIERVDTATGITHGAWRQLPSSFRESLAAAHVEIFTLSDGRLLAFERERGVVTVMAQVTDNVEPWLEFDTNTVHSSPVVDSLGRLYGQVGDNIVRFGEASTVLFPLAPPGSPSEFTQLVIADDVLYALANSGTETSTILRYPLAPETGNGQAEAWRTLNSTNLREFQASADGATLYAYDRERGYLLKIPTDPGLSAASLQAFDWLSVDTATSRVVVTESETVFGLRMDTVTSTRAFVDVIAIGGDPSTATRGWLDSDNMPDWAGSQAVDLLLAEGPDFDSLYIVTSSSDYVVTDEIVQRLQISTSNTAVEIIESATAVKRGWKASYGVDAHGDLYAVGYLYGFGLGVQVDVLVERLAFGEAAIQNPDLPPPLLFDIVGVMGNSGVVTGGDGAPSVEVNPLAFDEQNDGRTIVYASIWQDSQRDSVLRIVPGIEYKVSYFRNGADVNSGWSPWDAARYLWGEVATILGNLFGMDNPGYVFDGWEGGGMLLNAGDTVTVTGDIDLIPVWTPLPSSSPSASPSPSVSPSASPSPTTPPTSTPATAPTGGGGPAPTGTATPAPTPEPTPTPTQTLTPEPTPTPTAVAGIGAAARCPNATIVIGNPKLRKEMRAADLRRIRAATAGCVVTRATVFSYADSKTSLPPARTWLRQAAKAVPSANVTTQVRTAKSKLCVTSKNRCVVVRIYR